MREILSCVSWHAACCCLFCHYMLCEARRELDGQTKGVLEQGKSRQDL